MIKEFVLQWPVLHQILHGGDGTGPEAMSHRTQTLRPNNEGAKVARSAGTSTKVTWTMQGPNLFVMRIWVFL